ncbi:MAG: diguanylate cyclase [Chloroflexi bacterium]|nr:diguanylate cyclase [Chloroflexota bacterium]
MSRRAWTLVLGTIFAGTILGSYSLLNSVSSGADLATLGVLALLSTLSQVYKSIFKSAKKSETEGNISFSLLLIFLSAGVFLLPANFFVLLVLIPHLFEWAKARLQKSTSLRAWYIQPFNIANHICCGLLAQQTYQFINATISNQVSLSRPLAALVALVIYLVLNQALTGLAVVLARGSTWKNTGMLQWSTLIPDFMLLCLGYPFALLWTLNPGYSLFVLSPVLLIQRALAVPQLQKEARIDIKTGLWNAVHFSRLFTAEMERATRFARPLSVIMADLDLLRNVNNTYGHLAGDTVLEAIGEVIRKTVREYDIAGRFGGEEFSICLPETECVEAITIAERIRENIAETPITIQTSPTPIHVTMSFGIASFPTDAQVANDLIHQADIAVYQAKLKGRNCVVSITDVPHSIRLESTAHENRLMEPTVSPSPSPVAPARRQSEHSDVKLDAEHLIRKRREIPHRPEWIAPFVGAVILAGLLATVLSLGLNYTFDAGLLVFLCIVSILAEWFEVGMYGDSTFSVSVTVIFATIFLSGFVGLVSISTAIVFAHYLKNREIAWYKPVFNWATHVLAGLVPIYGLDLFKIPLTWENLIPLTGLTLVTGLGYYIVESGLVSIAIGLSEKSSILVTWRGQFGWTALFYVTLCLIGLFMAILCNDLNSILGVFVFALPIGLIHYTQQQYVERTRASVREVERMNKELTLANREILQASLHIEQFNDELFVILAKIIDTRDPLVLNHAVKVAEYATAIAREMKLPPARIEKLRQAALLHDIGKIGIPEHILKKTTRLTGLEYESIKTHTILGSELLEASQGLRHLAPFVRHHHEWWNGKGYPDELSGGQTPIEARIIAVADAIESMASDRTYHRAMKLQEIIDEISRNAGTQFDPTIADLFIRFLKQDGMLLVVNSTKQNRRTNESPRANSPFHFADPGLA